MEKFDMQTFLPPKPKFEILENREPDVIPPVLVVPPVQRCNFAGKIILFSSVLDTKLPNIRGFMDTKIVLFCIRAPPVEP